MAIMCRAGDADKRVYTLALLTLWRHYRLYKEEKGTHPRKADIIHTRYAAMAGMLAPILNNFWVCAFPYTDDETWFKNASVPMIDSVDVKQIAEWIDNNTEWKNVDDTRLLTIIREHMESKGYKTIPAFNASVTVS